MTRWPSPLRNDPPERSNVLQQSTPYSARRWRNRLSDPGFWPDIPTERTGDIGGWPRIDRGQVLAIGADASHPAGAIHTFVAAAVWGTGTSARAVERCAQVLDSDPSQVGEDLAEAARIVRSDGPAAAYRFLHPIRNRIKHLGPAFGTKFLYFAGYDRTSGPRQPLILDKNVAAALTNLGAGQWPSTAWPSQQYADYLDIAHDWAQQWQQTSPDVVERVLFSIGKAERLAINCLAPNITVD